MRYDLFISYARKDNEGGWVTAFVEALLESHRRFSGRELNVFFDKKSIHTMQDWRWRIAEGLRDAWLMLAFLSPNYKASEYCRMEWDTYSRHEVDRFVVGEGIAPVYIVEIPGFEDDASTDEWVKQAKARNYLDAQDWYREGPERLQRKDIADCLDELSRQIDEQRSREGKARNSFTNLPAYNRRFVGRVEEIRQVRECLALGDVGVVATLHGLGGVGKTELALAYAHAFVWDYPGGRYLVRCEGQSDLRTVLVASLVEPLGIELTDEQKKDPARAYDRVRRELEQRERVLLVLDNVDRDELLSSAQAQWLPDRRRVQVLATTRLPLAAGPDMRVFTLDVLPEADAVKLLGSYRELQPGEEEAAREIVRRLAGHTLAVEVVGVYLGKKASVSLEGYLERMDAEGLVALDAVGAEAWIRHPEAVLSKLLAPTLEMLSPLETAALRYAALLPPDFIPPVWLRSLVSDQFPEVAEAPAPGHPDVWEDALQRLDGLRLLIRPAEAALSRMHRLVQQVVGAADAAREERQAAVVRLARSRCEFLEEGWREWENRWEIEPLGALAEHLMERGVDGGTWIANSIALWLDGLARYAEAEPLYQRALAIAEKSYGPDHPSVARDLNNLAELLRATNRPEDAEPLVHRALAIDEKSYGPDHPSVATDLNNLALLLSDTNRLAEAERLYRRVLAIFERSLGADHPNVATALNNLAGLLRATNRLAEAERLYRRALAIDEKSYGPDHPTVAIRLNNLAELLSDTNRFAEAERLSRRHLEVFLKFTRATGHPHPHLMAAANNYAGLLAAMGVPRAEADERVKKLFADYGVDIGADA